MTSHRSEDMPNFNIKLSHHEKRTNAWKVLLAVVSFFFVLFSAGLLYHFLSIGDPILSSWMIGVAFSAIAMFGLGYLMRDSLPSRMNARCRRFYYMGKEFNIWHWKRSQVLLADIFLVSIGGALFGWSFANTILHVIGGFTWWDVTPLFYLPFFYFPLWFEVIAEIFLLSLTVIGFIYEAKTWLLGKKADLCAFEGFRGYSEGMDYTCDPGDIDCDLNSNIYRD